MRWYDTIFITKLGTTNFWKAYGATLNPNKRKQQTKLQKLIVKYVIVKRKMIKMRVYSMADRHTSALYLVQHKVGT